jgi:peptidoglycan/LPS O-acetylase OafA/YrhL
MFHLIAIQAGHAFLHEHGWFLPVSLVLTIVLAYASYRWFESPFLRLKQHFTHVESHPV